MHVMHGLVPTVPCLEFEVCGAKIIIVMTDTVPFPSKSSSTPVSHDDDPTFQSIQYKSSKIFHFLPTYTVENRIMHELSVSSDYKGLSQ